MFAFAFAFPFAFDRIQSWLKQAHELVGWPFEGKVAHKSRKHSEMEMSC